MAERVSGRFGEPTERPSDREGVRERVNVDDVDHRASLLTCQVW